MIAFLRGKLAGQNEDSIFLDVGGVGYQVFVPTSTFGWLPGPDQAVMIHTQLHVREDALVLYGFGTQTELDTFALLLTIPGIGPKVALSVLSVCSPGQLAQAITGEDLDALTRVPGIGKKTAQRMILELKDRIAGLLPVGMPIEERSPAGVMAEVAAALQVLGYAPAEVDRALRAVGERGKSMAGTEDLVRQALLFLRDR